MWGKKFTTFHLIYLWGGLTLLFSMLYYGMLGTNWEAPTFVIALVSFLILVGATTWQVAIGIKRNRQRFLQETQQQQLFKPSYQQTDDSEPKYEYSALATTTEQRVHISLFPIIDTHVEFISILFEGKGIPPRITLLDDWHYDRGNVPDKIHKPYFVPKVGEGRWYWEYKTPFHRFPSSRITIGLEYIAAEYFNGYLAFEMTTTNGRARQRLPFTIMKEENNAKIQA